VKGVGDRGKYDSRDITEDTQKDIDENIGTATTL